MITSHTSARDYCCSVLDHVGAPRILRERIEQRYGRTGEKGPDDPRGMLQFATNQGAKGVEHGHTMAQVAYTLPIEPHELRRKILVAYDPDAPRWLKARGLPE